MKNKFLFLLLFPALTVFSQTDTEAPSIPANLQCLGVSTTSVNLTWDASTDNVGVTGYIVYRNNISIDTVADLTFTDADLTDNTTYTYKVAAIDLAENTSAQSGQISVTTMEAPDTEAPTTPTNLQGEGISTTSISLSWSASTDNKGVTGYIVYRDNMPVDTVTTLTFTDNGLTVNTSYAYKVAAIDQAGNKSVDSGEINVLTLDTPDTEAPTMPSNLQGEGISSSSISLTWSASTDNRGVTGYVIYRDNVLIDTSTVLTFTDEGLTANTSYSYKITAIDKAGNMSDQSSSVDISTLTVSADTEAPTTPSNLQGEGISTTSINLTWNESTDNVGVTGYIIYRNDISIDTISIVAFTDGGLTANTSYTYKIVAFDQAGNKSSESTLLTVSTIDTPDTEAPIAPTNLQGRGTSTTTINLTWSASTDNIGVTGYIIYQNSVSIDTVSELTFTNAGLTINTSYDYNIAALDKAGNLSTLSNLVTVATLLENDTLSPSAPPLVGGQGISSSEIYIHWTASTDDKGVSGYMVYRDTILVGTTSELNFTDNGLQTSTVYIYQIIAFDEFGNLSKPSSWLSISTLAEDDTESPSVPTFLAATPLSLTSIKLVWVPSSDNVMVKGYIVFRDSVRIDTVETNSFIDTGLTTDTVYKYQVLAFDFSGNESLLSDSLLTKIPIPNIIDLSATLSKISLFPNPSSGNVTLELNLEASVNLAISVFNTNGQKLKELSYDQIEGGEVQVLMNLSDLPEGIYICQLFIGNQQFFQKIQIAK